jgi:hypothetical protein
MKSLVWIVLHNDGENTPWAMTRYMGYLFVLRYPQAHVCVCLYLDKLHVLRTHINRTRMCTLAYPWMDSLQIW